MAQLKRDHSGYHSSGLWIKYKQPAIDERQVKPKSKKGTAKWCRGKTGVGHVKRRFFYYVNYWDSRKRTSRIYCKCINCGKEFRGRYKDIPLVIEPEHDDRDSFPVQVKVNGVALPIDVRRFHPNSYYCRQCQEWHY